MIRVIIVMAVDFTVITVIVAMATGRWPNMETFWHPVNQLINNLKYLDDHDKGDTLIAEDLRKEIHEVFIAERGDIEDARISGTWYYNDEQYVEEDWDDFVRYWADVLML